MTPAVPVLALQGMLDANAPDPAVLKVGGTWYAYSTQHTFFEPLPVRTSTDLQTWSGRSNVLELPDWATNGHNWAPSVVATAADHYVLWYATRHTASDRQCVSRGVADNPEGPFVDDTDEPPVCDLALGGSIDPYVFTDTDGSRWLYWKSDENALGNRSRIWVAPLSADATTLTGTAVEVLEQNQDWEDPTLEQPAVVRSGATYYLFYSAGWCESVSYGMGYATGPSPTGPFTKQTTGGPWLATATGGRRSMRFGSLTLP